LCPRHDFFSLDSGALKHFPATPLCSIGWYTVGHSELLPPGAAAAIESTGKRLPPGYFAGPSSRPAVSRNSAEGHGLILVPDAVQALTGLNPADWGNRAAPLDEAPGTDCQAMGQAVLQAADDVERVRRIEDFLTHPLAAGEPTRGLAGLVARAGLGPRPGPARRRKRLWPRPAPGRTPHRGLGEASPVRTRPESKPGPP
jgi:hypothetical protein